jgi:cell division septation protein DedD
MMVQHENEVAPSMERTTSNIQKSDNTTPVASLHGNNDPEKGLDSENAESQPAEKSLAAGPTPATPVIGPPPDGGAQAWLVVLGAFSGLFVSFGWINCK